MKTKAILFDFDGVIADTEPQYDFYFNRLGEEYGLGNNFAAKVKGVTLPNMLEKYFSALSENVKQKITADTLLFEKNMDFRFIRGAQEFIDYLKTTDCKTALVTSSPQGKMDIALEKMGLSFDTIVTATQITQGKPHPMCYLLAAENLGVSPNDCVVFEDSIAGIQSGKAAGAKVVALATTLPAETLKNYAENIIPDFGDLELINRIIE
ncbi:MAG: HAD family phosphatase [Prevotellaceae bacterium]|jgi:HAD superfamily hydrolase (TIGR01509 family)|nr:HAD family phosphatase [Prevotellaceae bacterium]